MTSVRVACMSLLCAGTAIAQCPNPAWQTGPTTGMPGVFGANCAVMWDPDGPGPTPERLVVSSYYNIFGATKANHIAMWDGSSWQDFGDGVDSSIFALTVSATGELIAGGVFAMAGGQPASSIAKWNGSSWSPLGSGVNGVVFALASAPSGDLYAAGVFTEAGGLPVNSIARWDGSAWHDVGGGVSSPFPPGEVRALAVLPGGTVVAGGSFSTAGGNPASGIAAWNGSTWTSLGGGLDFGGNIAALSTLPSGDIVAAGFFGSIGGVPASNIARWNGTSWNAMGGGLNATPSPFISVQVFTLATLPNGHIVAGGIFDDAGGVPATSIAEWNGSGWSGLDVGVNLRPPEDPFYHAQVNGIAAASNGDVYAVGSFDRAGVVPAANVARWNNASWSALGSGTDRYVLALTRCANGDLIAGGNFLSIDGVSAAAVARRVSGAWHPMGTGISGVVLATCEASNGDIIAAGQFSQAGGTPVNNIARWDGSAWHAMGDGLGNGGVWALGRSPSGEIHAAGEFLFSGANEVRFLAKWTGSSWVQVGTSLNTSVYSIAFEPTGDIVAGGQFSNDGATQLNGIGRWNGTSWSALGTGTEGPFGGGGSVMSVSLTPSGEIIAGGMFVAAGGVPTESIAKWNGTAWEAMGDGLGGLPFNNAVFAITTGPSGETYAAGSFIASGASPIGRVARWNGTQWVALGLGVTDAEPSTQVRAMVALPSGDVFVGGQFLEADNQVSAYFARWGCAAASPCDPSGPAWTGVPANGGADSSIVASTVFQSSLYAGGFYSSIGGTTAHGLARWSGSSWIAVSVEPAAEVFALARHNDGSGEALYVGGNFSEPGGVTSPAIARWNGVTWSALGGGIGGSVRAAASFDPDGAGPSPALLVVGGLLSNAGGNPVSNIAAWNGTSWSPLGVGADGAVRCMAVWNDGSGPALYVGGDFENIGGIAASHIAKWNGVTWSTLGTGVDSIVAALEPFDDGSGPSLFVGGAFASAGPTGATYLARWDGSAWHELTESPSRPVNALRVCDDGSGSALFVGGTATLFGSTSANAIAKWNGTTWTALGSGLTLPAPDLGNVRSIESIDLDGAGPQPAAIFAFGTFDHAGGIPVSNVAAWRRTIPGPAFTQQPDNVTVFANQEALFSVAATGVGSLSYQWRRNGVPLADGGRISGATTTTLHIASTVMADAGSIDVVVTDDCSPRASATATFSVVCYANCDQSTVPPILNAIDFACFLNAYAAGSPYANCDGSVTPPVLNAIDFVCFLNSYAASCP